MIVNNDNFNVIQTAAKFRHRPILEYLLRVTRPKIPEIIDAYLILGAMTIILDSDYTNGLHHWQKAVALSRINTNADIYYSMRDSVLAQCLQVKELTCLESISRCSSDRDALCIQALLMYERNRGQYHENYINLLMYRGAVSADEEKFLLAINLWKTAYKLHLQKLDTFDENAASDVLSRNVMRNVQFLVKVFHHVHKLGKSRPTSYPGQDECVVPEDVARELFGLITRHINIVINIYTCSPKCEQPELGMVLRNLISLNPRGESNETLLHMCLDITTLDPLECDVSATLGNLWPSQAMLEILILLGADPASKDFFGNTVLHAAVALHNMGATVEPGVVIMLLRRGAHVDQVNDLGQTAADLLACKDSLRQVLHTTSLKCLAARVVASNRIQYVGEVPRTLYQFIELHGC
ncbi:unnamed protein product [Lymnaea stagnalis]|uniref:Uncharacterized protein n=1 Tax=Lymnaea stagnalis TaxID=6523 RepID=A0AAV2IHH3_LYMST